jgi:acyl-CoA synthetase (AMP-forming)/AMP-acid ligase II
MNAYAAVRLLGRGEQAGLVAYVVPVAGAELTRVGIRRALLQQLPAYMVPAKIMLLDDLPRTASGKIDRKRLPEHV